MDGTGSGSGTHNLTGSSPSLPETPATHAITYSVTASLFPASVRSAGQPRLNAISAGDGSGGCEPDRGGRRQHGQRRQLAPQGQQRRRHGRPANRKALGPANGAAGQVGFDSGGIAQFFMVAATAFSPSAGNSRGRVASAGIVTVGSSSAGTEPITRGTLNPLSPGSRGPSRTAPPPPLLERDPRTGAGGTSPLYLAEAAWQSGCPWTPAQGA